MARWGEADAEEFAAHMMLHIPTISAEFVSLWSLGDTRPLAGARPAEAEPRNFRQVYEKIVATPGPDLDIGVAEGRRDKETRVPSQSGA